MNPSEIGDVSVARVLAALVQNGEVVLVPFGDARRYDLAVDRNGQLVRVQVKTGRVRKGAILFWTCSNTKLSGVSDARKSYVGEADFFAVFCPETDSCYMVPADEVPSRQGSLRVSPPANGQKKGIRLAEDFKI